MAIIGNIPYFQTNPSEFAQFAPFSEIAESRHLDGGDLTARKVKASARPGCYKVLKPSELLLVLVLVLLSLLIINDY